MNDELRDIPTLSYATPGDKPPVFRMALVSFLMAIINIASIATMLLIESTSNAISPLAHNSILEGGHFFGIMGFAFGAVGLTKKRGRRLAVLSMILWFCEESLMPSFRYG